MALDDSLRGVRAYCIGVGFPDERFVEVRSVYNRTYSFHLVEHAVPFKVDAKEYQIRSHELILEAQARAARTAREYANKEVKRK